MKNLNFSFERILHIVSVLGILIIAWLNSNYVTQAQFKGWTQEIYWPREAQDDEAIKALQLYDASSEAWKHGTDRMLTDHELRLRERESSRIRDRAASNPPGNLERNGL